MNLEDRISKLEKSNKRFKVALALCLCMFMVSAKDIFIKDEIKAKTIFVDRLVAGGIEVHYEPNDWRKEYINITPRSILLKKSYVEPTDTVPSLEIFNDGIIKCIHKSTKPYNDCEPYK